MTNMSDIVNLTNEAAGKSDRWMFICSQILFLVAAWYVLRHVLDQNKELVKQLREEQTVHEGKLEGMVESNRESHDATVVALTQSNVVMGHTAEALKSCSVQLELCRETNKKGH